jgi:hypothetical protein
MKYSTTRAWYGIDGKAGVWYEELTDIVYAWG